MAKIHCLPGQLPIFLRTDGVFFQVKDLAEMAVKIEKHYGRPMEPGGKGTDSSFQENGTRNLAMISYSKALQQGSTVADLGITWYN